MKIVIKKQNPPFGENKICEICGSEIRVGIDYYYFIRDEKKEGKMICLGCKDEFYSNNEKSKM